MKGLSRQRLRCRQAEEPFGRRKRDFYIFKGIFFLRKENPLGKERDTLMELFPNCTSGVQGTRLADMLRSNLSDDVSP